MEKNFISCSWTASVQNASASLVAVLRMGVGRGVEDDQTVLVLVYHIRRTRPFNERVWKVVASGNNPNVEMYLSSIIKDLFDSIVLMNIQSIIVPWQHKTSRIVYSAPIQTLLN